LRTKDGLSYRIPSGLRVKGRESLGKMKRKNKKVGTVKPLEACRVWKVNRRKNRKRGRPKKEDQLRSGQTSEKTGSWRGKKLVQGRWKRE